LWIRVKDNCNGIPQIVDKVFQPFFTTKLTGEESGLSLAFDIIKAHGEIKVETLSAEKRQRRQRGKVREQRLPFNYLTL